MSTKTNRLSVYDIWFILPFSVWLLFQIFTTSFYHIYFEGQFLTILNYLCISVLFIREFFLIHSVSKKEVIYGLLILCIMYSLFLYKRDTTIILLFIVFGLRNTNKELIIKTMFGLITLSFIFIIVSSQIGVITDYIETTLYRTRHYLGFKYSLFGPVIYFNICAFYTYIKKNKVPFIMYFFMMAGNLYLYTMTISRLSFLFTVLLIVVAFIYKYFGYLFHFEKKSYIYLFLFLFSLLIIVLSFVVAYKYNANIPLFSKINNFLGDRLQLGHNAINQYGFALFGRDINYVGNGLNLYGFKTTGIYNYVDNFYLHYAIQYGLFFFGIIVLLITSLIISSKHKSDLYLATLVTLFAAKGFIDDLMLPLYYNSFFCLGSYLMVGKKENSKLLKGVMLFILLCMLYIVMNRFMNILIMR